MSPSETRDEPPDETSGEQPQIFRERSSSLPVPESDDTRTGIIRRHPTGPIPEPLSDDTRTSIIRHEPLPGHEGDATSAFRPTPQRIAGAPTTPRSTTAIAASAFGIVSGWATSVVATGLITGWWRTDRLFCVGVGFLTAVFGATTIAGVVALLLRRRVGIFLTIVAAVLALLIFAGIFVAGARMSGLVRALPVLPIGTIVLALVPATWRWTEPD